MPGVIAFFRAAKIALPLSIILGLAIALWLAKRDANHWHLAYTSAIAAGAAAEQKQIALAAAEKARQQRQAELADVRYQNEIERAGGLARRYIANHSVRTVCPGALGRTDPVPEAGDPGVPESAPAYPVVVTLDAADVEACSADYIYASQAHEWAQEVSEDGGAGH